MGSNVSSFLLSSAAYIPAMLAGFLRFSLLSTSLQCSYHLLVFLCLSLRMLPFLSFTVAQRVCLWLRNTLVWEKKSSCAVAEQHFQIHLQNPCSSVVYPF